MTPDLTNTADVDPEGWLTELDRTSGEFIDRWEANPDQFTAIQITNIVFHAKSLILAMQEALELADGTVGEHAARKAMKDQEDKQLRLDQSAAKVRGMSLDEYKADVARRKAEKAKESARETIEGEAT
jgi:hypothetical protein